MNQLREYIRQILLAEGMKTVENMNGRYAKIFQRSDGMIIFKVLGDGDWHYEEGYLHIKKAGNEMCSGAYEVKKSSAEEGWGPFLYDMAIEWTGEHGLMCDRNSVSSEAANVWDHYLNSRPDILAVQLDKVPRPFLTPEDVSDDCPQRSFLRWAHDDLDAAGSPEGVYNFDSNKVPDHGKIYKAHWATKKYVRKDGGTPTLDALRAAGKLKE